MRGPIPIDPRVLTAALIATGLLASAIASACSDAKTPGVSASTPTQDNDAVVSASTCPEQTAEATTPVVPAGLARFRDGDTRGAERTLGWLIVSPAPRAAARAVTDRIAKVNERKSGSGSELSKPARESAKRGGTKRGGSTPVARPHRMPSPEIL